MIDRPVKIVDAIRSLLPSASFTIYANDYEQIIWDSEDIPIPSFDEVKGEVARLESERLRLRYRLLREPEYPPIGDQLDALFHAGVFPPEMEAQIAAVKEQYPKPTAQ